MIEIKDSDWYNQYGDFEIKVKIKDGSVKEAMKLQGIVARASKDLREVLEQNPKIVANSGTQYSGYTLPKKESN